MCLSQGYLVEELLKAGETATADDVIGPSVVLSIPPVALSEEGEWIRATDQAPIDAVVVDLSEAALQGLSQADLLLGGSVPFAANRPGVAPRKL